MDTPAPSRMDAGEAGVEGHDNAGTGGGSAGSGGAGSGGAGGGGVGGGTAGMGPTSDADVDDGPDAGAEDSEDAGSDTDAGGGCVAMTFGASCTPVTCQNGACDEGSCWGALGDGTCDTCQTGWTGENCDLCDATHFGASCESPITCQNGTCTAGTCSGFSGNGQCDACDSGWLGPNCNQICQPYDVEACYDGPDGTQGEGICRAGIRVCHQSGLLWSPCMDQIKPRTEDICGNGLDDNCSGDDTDEVCGSSPVAVWVNAETGSDTNDGSYAAPYATINTAIQTGRKLIMVVADANGTVYEENLVLSSSHNGITFAGWGPTRPTLVGTVGASHCYDCVFENMELSYPDVADSDPDPPATFRGVHNYRSVFRNVRFSAPLGLPAGASLYSTHHGYDAAFIDVEVDDVVLVPGTDASSYTYALLNAQDHGTGSQFTRVRLGSIDLSGPAPETLNLEFIKAWGYCDQQPDAVTAVRNSLITGLDMSGMATTTTSFRAIALGCYLTFQASAGFMILNNTFADITATSVTFATLNLSGEIQSWISGNIVGPHAATTVTGLVSNRAATIDHSNLYGATTAVSGAAAQGSNNLAVDPAFVGGDDYHLAAGSPCIDTGDPQLTDGDGTRSDMGAYGGPLAP